MHDITYIHELGHAARHPISPLEDEIGADSFLGAMYAIEVKAGYFPTPSGENSNIFEFFQDIRSLAAFTNSSDFIHATSPAVPIIAQSITYNRSPLEYAQSLLDAAEKVALEVGKNSAPIVSIVPVLVNILEAKPPIEGEDVIFITPQEEEIIKKIIMAYGVTAQAAQTRDIENLHGQLSSQTRDKLMRAYDSAFTNHGKKIVAIDHRILYAAVAKLYQAGAFDDNDIGKQYACRFLWAAQSKPFQEYFNADPKIRFISPLEIVQKKLLPEPAAKLN